MPCDQADRERKSIMSKINPLLQELNILTGNWELEVSNEGTILARARTNFSWIENGAFLIQHSEAEPPLPTTPKIWIDNNPNPLVVIIGIDDDSRQFWYMYADVRGVHRVYQMSLENGIWKIWGKAGPGFYQRFEGRFNSDNSIIPGWWEKSTDGKKWNLDFEVLFKKV